MTPDSKWLEILKASGWQTTAIAFACGLFLLMVHWGWFQPLNPWVVPSVTLTFLLCACLAVASVTRGVLKLLFAFFPIEIWVVHWVTLRQQKRDLRDYIPYMTPHESAIISYLLAKNQKMFTATSDGGYAATLIRRGFVVCPIQSHLRSSETCPWIIPDHIWEILLEHKDQFPYEPLKFDETEVQPWRVPWMTWVSMQRQNKGLPHKLPL